MSWLPEHLASLGGMPIDVAGVGQQQPELQAGSASLMTDDWLRQLHQGRLQQKGSAARGGGTTADVGWLPQGSGGGSGGSGLPQGGGLSLHDPLASATVLFRPTPEPEAPQAGQQQQQQQQQVPADAAALHQVQRRALLQLRQQMAAAAAAKEQQQLLQQQLQHATHPPPMPPPMQQQQQQQYMLPADGGHAEWQQQQPQQQEQQQGLPQPRQAPRQQQGQQQAGSQQQGGDQGGGMAGPLLEVESDLLEKEGERVVSALGGGRAQRAWALNALCLLSFRQELRLAAAPGLLAALLPVLQEGLAVAVGLAGDEGGASTGTGAAAANAAADDDRRAAAGLPPLPGWQRRRAERVCGGLFPDRARLEERLQEAAAAACILRNAAEVQQNAPLLVDPPVMRCWTWALDAARELVQQQVGDASGGGGGDGLPGGGLAGGRDGVPSGGEEQHPSAYDASDGGGGSTDGGTGTDGATALVVGGGTAADICTSLLQMATVLSGRMLLPAFFECGMLLLRSLLILLRPSWQHSAVAAGGVVLPPPLVTLATLAVTAVATAYQPNTDILLSMTGAPSGGQPGATLMLVVADLLACPFGVFRQHAQQTVDEESPGWRQLLPTDGQLLAEGRRSGRPGGGTGGGTASSAAAAAAAGLDGGGRTAAEQCTLDMLAVLSQLRYLSALLHLLWRLMTAEAAAGAHARRAAAACPRLLSTLLEVAVHRWPQHPARWHASGHGGAAPDAYPAYLRFLSHDMMPAMRERQDLLQPLRADAAALLALLAADPETRHSVSWCEGQLVTAVMLGIVPPTEPGISALLARFAA